MQQQVQPRSQHMKNVFPECVSVAVHNRISLAVAAIPGAQQRHSPDEPRTLKGLQGKCDKESWTS